MFLSNNIYDILYVTSDGKINPGAWTCSRIDPNALLLQDFKPECKAVLLDCPLNKDHIVALENICQPYLTFYTDNVHLRKNEDLLAFNRLKKLKLIQKTTIQKFERIILETDAFFCQREQGLTVMHSNMNYCLNDDLYINGNNYVKCNCCNNDRYQQFLYSDLVFHLKPNCEYDIVPRFDIFGSIKVMLRIVLRDIDSTEMEIIDLFPKSEKLIVKNNHDKFMAFSFSVYAKGQGQIKFKHIEIRKSFRDFGVYQLGGKTFSIPNKAEFSYLFEPGDLKPPLIVYFAGYHTGKSFECYNLLKTMHTPFLLFTDSRNEGGEFYLSTPEMEKQIVKQVTDKLNYLGFGNNQLVLTGLSMGSFAALYYAVDLNPKAIIAGRNICNLGLLAANQTLLRPNEFQTSLDIYEKLCEERNLNSVKEVDELFWSKLNTMHDVNIDIRLGCMTADEYDSKAKEELKDFFDNRVNAVYTLKQFEGKHTDKTLDVLNWFKGSIKNVLEENFDRTYHD